jgi:hypothetical protein
VLGSIIVLVEKLELEFDELPPKFPIFAMCPTPAGLLNAIPTTFTLTGPLLVTVKVVGPVT